MPRPLVSRSSLVLALLSLPCVANEAPTLPKANRELLGRLKECLDAVAKSGDENFVSPCIRLDVAGLSGLALANLKARLGAPGISSDDYVSVPNNANAPPQPYEVRWAFYRLPKSVLGGGPELQCISLDKVVCTQVRWVMTQ